jgi:hypothetical protein
MQQVAARGGPLLITVLGAGQGTWASALAKQVSVLAHLLLLGFGSGFGLEYKILLVNSSEGNLG